MSGVKESDLTGLFGALVRNLKVSLESGDATGKDKEIILQLLKQFSIGLTLEEAQPMEELKSSLPFDEVYPPN